MPKRSPYADRRTLAIRQRIARFKAALAVQGLTQRRAALDARIAETRFSDIMRGRVTPTGPEQQRLARVLQRSAETLFGQVAS
jgi:transcriptional regulator with XRE-family HTH domain